MRLTSYLYRPEETDLGIEACEIAYYIFEGSTTSGTAWFISNSP